MEVDGQAGSVGDGFCVVSSACQGASLAEGGSSEVGRQARPVALSGIWRGRPEGRQYA